jgi:hypothetical protein
MGIVQIIDPFYATLPEASFRRTPTLGQLCWVVSPHVLPIPKIMDVERTDAQEHFATQFQIRDMNPNIDFKIKSRLPIKALALRDTEELLIQRAKLRPAIIVALAVTQYPDVAKVLRPLGLEHLQHACILTVPLFGIQTAEHLGGFPPIMVARIRGLMYRQFFFCPRTNSPLTSDSVARLDRLQVVIHESSPGVKSAGYEPTKYALSADALGVLMGMLRSQFGSTSEEHLETVRSLAMEAIPDVARPAE